ncbi:MAG: hypothetical protein AAF416_23055 [Pseudomonadota bacterium]
MMRNDSNFDDKRQKDHDDLQNELAGRDTGRMARFLTGAERGPEDLRRKRAREVEQTHLMLALQDPAYRARYEEVSRRLTDAMMATEQALTHLNEQIAVTESELDDVQGAAARLPDGSRVYRDEAGAVRRENGSTVDATLAATILWTGDEPTYTDFSEARDRHSAALAERAVVEAYQSEVLAPAQERLEDPANPPSLEDLDRILEPVETEMPTAVSNHMPAPDEPAPEGDLGAGPSQAVVLPTLGP